MKSDQVTTVFYPVKMDGLIEYLEDLDYSYLISDFFRLNEVEITSYLSPKTISDTKESFNNSIGSKDTNSFKEFNTFVTAFTLVKECANLNMAIYSLKEKYHQEEISFAKENPGGVYHFSYFRDNIHNMNWYESSDKDVLRIRDIAYSIKDIIHSYNKKYTRNDFEEKFINKFKFTIYNTCNIFRIDTRTFTEKATEKGENIFFHILFFVLFCFAFFLVSKCASSL